MSTAQASRLSDDSNIPPAMLYKKQQHPAETPPTNSPQNAQMASGKGQVQPLSSPQPQAQPTSPEAKVKKSSRSNRRKNRGAGRGSTATKRKRAGSPQPPAKRKQVTSSTTMEDVELVEPPETSSTTMEDVRYVKPPANFPTPGQSPSGLSRKMRESPKEVLYNAIHNSRLGKLHSSFTTSRGGLFSCTLSCELNFNDKAFSVISQAANKVRPPSAISRAC